MPGQSSFKSPTLYSVSSNTSAGTGFFETLVLYSANDPEVAGSLWMTLGVETAQLLLRSPRRELFQVSTTILRRLS